MTADAAFGKIELHLIRVLQTLISERSVSRAAMRLGSNQPPGERAAAAPARAHRRRAAGARRQRHDADRDGDAIAGPGDGAAARGRPPVRRACEAAQLRGRRHRGDLPHRRQRLPRPAVPAGAGGPRQAAGAAGAARAAAAHRRLRLSEAPGRRRGRPGDRQLAAPARRAAPRPADQRRDRLPGRRRLPAAAAAGRPSATWPPSTSRRCPSTPSRPASSTTTWRRSA